MRDIFIVILLVASSAIAACGQTQEKSAETNNQVKTAAEAEKTERRTEKIGANILTLQNNQGKCQLLFNEQTINLDLPEQCDFHRSPGGEVRVFPTDFYRTKKRPIPKAYRDQQIILIEYSQPVGTTPNECRTELQAVKIVKSQLVKSTKMANLAACPPFQWDAKNFTALFE